MEEISCSTKIGKVTHSLPRAIEEQGKNFDIILWSVPSVVQLCVYSCRLKFCSLALGEYYGLHCGFVTSPKQRVLKLVQHTFPSMLCSYTGWCIVEGEAVSSHSPPLPAHSYPCTWVQDGKECSNTTKAVLSPAQVPTVWVTCSWE